MAFQIVWFPDKTKTTLYKFYCIVDYATVGLYLQQTFRDFSLQENEMVCVELVAKDKVFNQWCNDTIFHFHSPTDSICFDTIVVFVHLAVTSDVLSVQNQ